jgi:hypothetical protein
MTTSLHGPHWLNAIQVRFRSTARVAEESSLAQNQQPTQFKFDRLPEGVPDSVPDSGLRSLKLFAKRLGILWSHGGIPGVFACCIPARWTEGQNVFVIATTITATVAMREILHHWQFPVYNVHS